ARPRRGLAAGLGDAAPGLRRHRAPRGAARFAGGAVRPRTVSRAAAPEHRTLLPAIRRALLWRRRARRDGVGAGPVPGTAPRRKTARSMMAALSMESFEFAHPWLLLLAPLAVLPLLRRRRDALTFSWLAWLPPDPWGRAA